jgi:hypothetical protein
MRRHLKQLLRSASCEGFRLQFGLWGVKLDNLKSRFCGHQDAGRTQLGLQLDVI